MAIRFNNQTVIEGGFRSCCNNDLRISPDAPVNLVRNVIRIANDTNKVKVKVCRPLNTYEAFQRHCESYSELEKLQAQARTHTYTELDALFPLFK